jgi:hypothetical protein
VGSSGQRVGRVWRVAAFQKRKQTRRVHCCGWMMDVVLCVLGWVAAQGHLGVGEAGVEGSRRGGGYHIGLKRILRGLH